jgi:glycosyltransferase involved in cell wall biosynthesis
MAPHALVPDVLEPRDEGALRILFVLSTLERDWTGGIGRVAAGMAQALAERGHRVTLAGPAPDGSPGPVAGCVLAVWPPVRSKLGRLPHLLALQWRERAQLIHFHSARPPGALVVPFSVLRPWLGRPGIALSPYTGTRAHHRKPLSALAFARADAIIPNSRWSAERVIGLGIDPARVRVVPPGVAVGSAPDASGREPMVTALARLVPSKGLDVLLEAFDRAAATRPGWVLRIAGTGNEEAGLRGRAARLACADRVAFLGQVVGERKERLLARTSIGVVPSRADQYPGALLELQAAGVACVASAAGGIPEIAVEGRAARLVAPGDATALATALGELMDSAEQRNALAKEALAVSRGRSWPRVAEQLESVYRELCWPGREAGAGSQDPPFRREGRP